MREVDVVGVGGGRNVVVAGMCKWTTSLVDFNELNLLDRLIPHFCDDHVRPLRYLFSRTAFTERLSAHAAADETIRLVTPDLIYVP
jgi:hypothetical protein